MITIQSSGDFKKTKKFLDAMQRRKYIDALKQYAQRGVDALSANTPRDSGKTAASWSYEIHSGKDGYEIVWSNSNVVDGVNIAIILQYGHGTGTGGYVQGRDYINPALRPIFDEIAEAAWKEVIRA